ncbi:alpha-glucoside-specific PTS transporter subunit IIBC [Collinsella sp. An7]|uniref:alpha-glucoside-specific PTS transporter subunit IIBC n=1 Tax=Collinsella sp. An7 TaxID=1965651 RepID=UPI001EF53980|nr:alpha-glucoside-specific PTS transporter subunit IIBC [Collinsella sp. An7]
MKGTLIEKFQRFGGAMYTPVVLFTFPGMIVGLCAIFRNASIMGGLAADGTMWSQIWYMIYEGAQMVFRQMPLLFAMALPIGLAKKQVGRCVFEAIAVYLTFNYFLSAILTNWGVNFGIDFANMTTDDTGITLIASIKTLDTGIAGSLIVGAIVVWLHNRYYEFKLPEWLGVFKGAAFIYVLGFFAMIPLALAFAIIWPQIQIGFENMQTFFMSSGVVGVFCYTTLSRLLIPVGLHHFIYMPFNYGDAVVAGGLKAYWSTHVIEFSQYQGNLADIFPEGRFLTLGYAKVFGSPGIAAAFYFTAPKEKRPQVLALMLPVTLTAVIAGITEPIEFTFLFVAPLLFVVHSILAGALAAVECLFGVVNGSAGNLIEFALMNWIPLWSTQSTMWIKQIVIGLVFTGIWFVVFYFLITKLNLKTPGREDAEIRLYSKAEYRERQAALAAEGAGGAGGVADAAAGGDENGLKAVEFLMMLGGAENIVDVTNCATRLRVTVKDGSKVCPADDFKAAGAYGLVVNGNAIQVIVGMDVSIVRERFENLL